MLVGSKPHRWAVRKENLPKPSETPGEQQTAPRWHAMSLPNQPARPSGSKPSVTPQSPNGSGKPAPHPSKRHRWAPAADGPPDRRAQPSGRAGLQPPLPSAQHIFQEQVELEHPANRSRPAGPRRLPYFYQFTERPTFTREAQQWQAMQPPRSPPTAWWQRQQHPANGATSAQPQEPAARPLPKPALKSKAITREVAVPRDVTVGQLAQLLGEIYSQICYCP